MMKNRKILTHEDFDLHACAGGSHDFFLTASLKHPTANTVATCDQLYREICAILTQAKLEIVKERIFGSLQLHDQILAGRRSVMRAIDDTQAHPITFIQGQPLWGTGLAGIQIQAVFARDPQEKVWSLYDGQAPCGRAWTRNGATYLLLQNLSGVASTSAPNQAGFGAQTERMLERADRLLQAQGSGYSDVVRTWIYLSDILDWYDEFNVVRNAKYAQWGLMPNLQQAHDAEPLRLPASTGIRGDNPLGAACVMDLLAVTGSDGSRPKIVQMTNRKQKDAFQYQRAFSRGACIQEPDQTCIHVSGTAAIDEQGQSLYLNNVKAQIHRTLDNVEALLEPVGASLKQLSSGTVFLKRREDAAIYHQIAAERGLATLPTVAVVADVCRPELLFEIDAVLCVPCS